MKATIKTQGKQFAVTEGDVLKLDRFPDAAEGATLQFDALTVGEGDDFKLGSPFVEGAKVTATVLENRRGPKVHIFKKKKRKGYENRRGHRQELTVVKIDAIEA